MELKQINISDPEENKDKGASCATQDIPLSINQKQSLPKTDSNHSFDSSCPKGRMAISIGTKDRFKRLSNTLLLAIENGATDELMRLMDHGPNPDAACWSNHISPCHLAALKDDDSLSLLIKTGADIFRADSWGRTSLHYAAWAGHAKQITLLLNNIKDLPNIDEGNTENAQKYVKNLLIDKLCDVDIDPDLPKQRKNSLHYCNGTLPVFGSGWTALHSASARVHYACVQLLLDAGADPSLQDLSGRTPLDVVGEAYYSKYEIDVHTFRKTIMALIAAGGRISHTNTQSKNKVNTSLHVAVELGSEEAIQELLDAGATTTCLNSNGFTPMHICVEKRLREHLQLLANFQNSDVDLENPINCKENNGLTVLHAAIRAGWTVGACIALEAGASVLIKADDGDAPIHSAAAKGDLDILQVLLPFANNYINLQNKEGHTALFVAIKHNHLEVVKLMIENYASLRVESPCRNVLHIAAEYGRADILNFLLNCDEIDTSYLINQRYAPGMHRGFFWSTPGAWYTPIIYAVDENHPVCVVMLLQKGAEIDIHVPYFENVVYKKRIWATALNIAAIKNHLEIAKIIINFDSESVNRPSSTGVLPLHEACIHGNKELITLLISEGADLSAECPKLKSPIELLMNHLSKPTAFMEEFFDSCISTIGVLQDKTYKVKVDYGILWPNSLNSQKMDVIKALINTGNRHGQRTLLQHPLIESFLHLQWQRLLPFFYMNLALYGLFALSVNVYIVSLFYFQDGNKVNTTNETILENNNLYPNQALPYYLCCNFWKIIIYLTVGLIVMQEVYFLITTRTLILSVNWVKFGALISSLFVTIIASWRDSEMVLDVQNSPEWLRLIASIAVFLTWLEMMFLLSRFPSWGIYALMFGKVTTKVLFTFGFMIIGFSLCFMIQFRAKPPFDGPLAAVTKTLVMMTSEYDYTSTINEESVLTIDASIIVLRVIFMIFVIIASIVLMNLMVGVAVHDVSYLEKVGHQKRLQKQVDLILQQGKISYLISKFHPKYLDKKYIELEPNKPMCVYNKILPRHIKESILEKAQLQIKKVDDDEVTTNSEKLNEVLSTIVREENLRKTTDTVESLKKEMENVRADLELMKQLLQNIIQGINQGSVVSFQPITSN